MTYLLDINVYAIKWELWTEMRMCSKEVCYEELHYESRLYKSKPKTSTFSWAWF